MNSTWVLLALAIAAEAAGTTALRESDSFSRLGPVVIVVISYSVSFYLLSVVVQTLSLGVAYAVWAGVGTVAIAVIGASWFGDALRAPAIAGIALIVAGVVLINFSPSR